MRTYILLIKSVQQIFLAISILILATFPGIIILYPEALNTDWLFFLAHTSLFLVMIVRPLADLLTNFQFVRPLVILRKGVGVFSASIIVSFILVKVITDPVGYLTGFTNASYWSLDKMALFAHLADISAILLLVTSNNLSKRLLGDNWKRLQRLSYVYFYGSGLYVMVMFQDYLVLVFMIIITIITLLANQVNQVRRLNNIQ